jgi:hypothetical protein
LRVGVQERVDGGVVERAVILQRVPAQHTVALEAEPLQQPDGAGVVDERAGLYPVRSHRGESTLDDRACRLRGDAVTPVCRREFVAQFGARVMGAPRCAAR